MLSPEGQGEQWCHLLGWGLVKGGALGPSPLFQSVSSILNILQIGTQVGNLLLRTCSRVKKDLKTVGLVNL